MSTQALIFRQHILINYSPLAATSTDLPVPAKSTDQASPSRDGTLSPSVKSITSPSDVTHEELDQKDLSFLLAPEIYHPLSQLEIPLPLRLPLPTISTKASLSSLLEQVDELLSKGHFLPAAHLSALILTSGKITPTDNRTVFHLLGVRYSCLELTGNTTLAAQEAKALEDLNSAFYFTSDENAVDGEKVDQHIMPYALRLQALHLQSLGFGDPRRGISSLYDLGLECREQIALPTKSAEDRLIWRKRLRDLGIRVVNALIEMDDLDAAKRTLMSTTGENLDPETLSRIVLLLLKMGDTTTVRNLLEKYDSPETTDITTTMLPALLSVAEGRGEDAVQQWQSHLTSDTTTHDDSNKRDDREAMIKQNLAVALLYIGHLSDVSPHTHIPIIPTTTQYPTNAF